MRIVHGNREQTAVILNRVVRYVPKDADGRMAMALEGSLDTADFAAIPRVK